MGEADHRIFRGKIKGELELGEAERNGSSLARTIWIAAGDEPKDGRKLLPKRRNAATVAASIMEKAVSVFFGVVPRVFLGAAAACCGLGGVADVGGAREVVLREGHGCSRPLAVLYQGRQVNTHHSPSGFHNLIRVPFAERGVRFDFTTNLADLNPDKLAQYDALFVYGNAFYLLSSAQEAAMKGYVEAGGGIAAMHVACWSLPYSQAWTALVGGGFLGHYAIQEFTPVLSDVDHPILRGLETYTSEDEPYQFKDLALDRTVLSYRTGPGAAEAVSWVRHQGAGRVFYQAGGHDIRTWSQPNFQELTIRGIKWAAKAPGADVVAAIDRAWMSEGGAVCALVGLDRGTDVRQALMTGSKGAWLRPVLSGDKVYDRTGDSHEGILPASVRVGGSPEASVVAMAGGAMAGGTASEGVWTGRAGVVATGVREGDWLEWSGGYWEVVALGADGQYGLAMNDSGRWACQAIVRSEDMLQERSVMLRGARGQSPEVVLGEGNLVVESEETWTAGKPIANGMSMDNTGRTAVIVEDGLGSRLLVDETGGWKTLLVVGSGIPGLPGQVVGGLSEVRMNDAGGMVVRGVVQGGGGGSDIVWCRTPGGVWREVLRDGEQGWLATGEAVTTQGAGTGAWLDAGGGVWIMGSVSGGEGVSRILAWCPPEGGIRLRCREGETHKFGRRDATVVSLGSPSGWSFGPSGMALGAITVVEGSGTERQWLARWHGGHALSVCNSGEAFVAGGEMIEVQSVRVSGGGTGQDGFGGAINTAGEWTAVVTSVRNEDLLVTGGDLKDADGDGREDLLEDAMGADPRVADASNPLVEVKQVDGERWLVFKRDPSGDFTYQVEISDDLRNWAVSQAPVRVAADQTGVEQGFERVEVPIAGERAFLRVKVGCE